MNMLRLAEVKELLEYAPETGVLKWKERSKRWFWREGDHKGWNTAYKGKEVRHRTVVIEGRPYEASHLIWVLHYGKWPKHSLKYIDKDFKNRKITNLMPQKRDR